MHYIPYYHSVWFRVCSADTICNTLSCRKCQSNSKWQVWSTNKNMTLNSWCLYKKSETSLQLRHFSWWATQKVLLGQEQSVDCCVIVGFWLANHDHVTWTLASDWLIVVLLLALCFPALLQSYNGHSFVSSLHSKSWPSRFILLMMIRKDTQTCSK